MCRGTAKSHGVGLAPLRSAKARVVTTTRSDYLERATPVENAPGAAQQSLLGLLWWSCCDEESVQILRMLFLGLL
jgi:hypothetical protein